MTSIHRSALCAAIAAVLALGACGDDDTCDPINQSGCDDGSVCETVDGSDAPACFAPVVLRGQVFDLADDSAIAGARVVALDVNRSPVSSVAITDDDGSYELGIPSTRLEDGTPIGIELTLRADADGYQTFPSGVRQALPIDTASATAIDGPWVVESALTDIGLIELPAGSGTASIYGTAETPPDGAGVLVVAETSTGYSAIADRDGDYAILNLPAGTYDVVGYAKGVNYDSVSVTVGDGESAEADLSINGSNASVVTGSIQMVDAGDASATSVIMVVESTFDEFLGRGTSPPGLRAPEPGLAPDVTGAFTIEGVPAGNYVVLAAFENDLLVRDPDSCIAGTDFVHQTVAAGQDVTIEESFKTTGSLQIVGPGAAGAEAVSGSPIFEWLDDSGEKRYDLTVFDSFGNIVWEHEEPEHTGTDPAVPYAGPALEPGMYYQFRVVSWRERNPGSWCEISQTEDLKGVFFVE